jgi:RNA polymerase sigma-70 factor (ECF subfamily)
MVPSEPDDKELVERARIDPRGFADLYARHFDRVYAFVRHRVALRSDAEDLTGEVFKQALANFPRFEWRGVPFIAWLYRIAGNAIADHYARAARERTLPAGGDAEAEGAAWEVAERRALLYRAVRELPADQQRVVHMRFGEERTVADIARALGRSEGAIKQLQFRALQQLRARLDRDHA